MTTDSQGKLSRDHADKLLKASAGEHLRQMPPNYVERVLLRQSIQRQEMLAYCELGYLELGERGPFVCEQDIEELGSVVILGNAGAGKSSVLRSRYQGGRGRFTGGHFSEDS